MSIMIDQAEIDALIAKSATTPAPAPSPQSKSTPTAPGPRPLTRLERILRIRVPVIVRLAQRTQSIAEIRRFSLGMMIEFAHDAEARLALLVNNRIIGHGHAVKTGEKFGLRIAEIASPTDRVKSLK